MLAYAFQVLNEDCYKKVALEDFEHAQDLFAAILSKGISSQIKRGLGREYITQINPLYSPCGKISISSSIKERALYQRQLVCEYDDFSENAYINQILKTVALILMRSTDVKKEHKGALRKVMLYFHSTDILQPDNIQWSSIRYHSNNSTYKMLINICYLVVKGFLPAGKGGSKKFPQFSDEHMHRLFEKFVLEYYRKHYPEYKVSSKKIDWNTDDGVVELLPAMKTDIFIEYKGKILIIDTKYYSHTMQLNNMYGSRSIHSSNLYQIFAYVKNSDIDHTGNVSGILLYAKTDDNTVLDRIYHMDGNRISVKTLDLDINFANIKNQLDIIISEWQGHTPVI
jgi:5-methylcytosine-specific restriction enzyme subunit McrC